MSKMVPITSPDLILSSCMEPGHREPLDQLFKRWLDLLFDPLSPDTAMRDEIMTPREPLSFWLAAAEVVRWWKTTTWAMPAALELRGEQQVPLQLFVGTWTCSGTPRTLGGAKVP